MWCFEIQHVNEKTGDVKKIGYFSSLSAAETAISRLIIKPGFCESKNGFILVRYWIHTDEQTSPVFEVLVFIHTSDYIFEHEIKVGLFASLDEAETALNEFKEINSHFDVKLEVEYIINCCTINQIEWFEGFITE